MVICVKINSIIFYAYWSIKLSTKTERPTWTMWDATPGVTTWEAVTGVMMWDATAGTMWQPLLKWWLCWNTSPISSHQILLWDMAEGMMIWDMAKRPNCMMWDAATSATAWEVVTGVMMWGAVAWTITWDAPNGMTALALLAAGTTAW